MNGFWNWSSRVGWKGEAAGYLRSRISDPHVILSRDKVALPTRVVWMWEYGWIKHDEKMALVLNTDAFVLGAATSSAFAVCASFQWFCRSGVWLQREAACSSLYVLVVMKLSFILELQCYFLSLTYPCPSRIHECPWLPYLFCFFSCNGFANLLPRVKPNASLFWRNFFFAWS